MKKLIIILFITSEIGFAQKLISDFGKGVYNHVNPQKLTLFGGQVLFLCDDSTNKTNIWISDGTSENTHLLLERHNAPKANQEFISIKKNNKLFFYFDENIWCADSNIKIEKIAKVSSFDKLIGFGNFLIITDSTAIDLKSKELIKTTEWGVKGYIHKSIGCESFDILFTENGVFGSSFGTNKITKYAENNLSYYFENYLLKIKNYHYLLLVGYQQLFIYKIQDNKIDLLNELPFFNFIGYNKKADVLQLFTFDNRNIKLTELINDKLSSTKDIETLTVKYSLNVLTKDSSGITLMHNTDDAKQLRISKFRFSDFKLEPVIGQIEGEYVSIPNNLAKIIFIIDKTGNANYKIYDLKNKTLRDFDPKWNVNLCLLYKDELIGGINETDIKYFETDTYFKGPNSFAFGSSKPNVLITGQNKYLSSMRFVQNFETKYGNFIKGAGTQKSTSFYYLDSAKDSLQKLIEVQNVYPHNSYLQAINANSMTHGVYLTDHLQVVNIDFKSKKAEKVHGNFAYPIINFRDSLLYFINYDSLTIRNLNGAIIGKLKVDSLRFIQTNYSTNGTANNSLVFFSTFMKVDSTKSEPFLFVFDLSQKQIYLVENEPCLQYFLWKGRILYRTRKSLYLLNDSFSFEKTKLMDLPENENLLQQKILGNDLILYSEKMVIRTDGTCQNSQIVAANISDGARLETYFSGQSVYVLDYRKLVRYSKNNRQEVKLNDNIYINNFNVLNEKVVFYTTNLNGANELFVYNFENNKHQSLLIQEDVIQAFFNNTVYHINAEKNTFYVQVGQYLYGIYLDEGGFAAKLILKFKEEPYRFSIQVFDNQIWIRKSNQILVVQNRTIRYIDNIENAAILYSILENNKEIYFLTQKSNLLKYNLINGRFSSIELPNFKFTSTLSFFQSSDKLYAFAANTDFNVQLFQVLEGLPQKNVSEVIIDVEIPNSNCEPIAKKQYFKIFPNPVQNTLRVAKLEKIDKDIEVSIVSTLGYVLQSKKWNAEDADIKWDLNSLQNGLYVVWFRNQTVNESHQMCIQN